MPRADRYMMEGYVYHLTHRCHNRAFLLGFARDRDAYREWLRIGVKRYKVPVFAYSITCNHVHIVAHVQNRDAVGRLMDLVAGATARQYNRRKGRRGAFWEGKYHATAIESGLHLWRCLRYVELNMVRAGEVAHPSQWRWCGYDEHMGLRRRYRILDKEGLLELLDGVPEQSFRSAHAAGINERVAAGGMLREPAWTDGLAVGSRSYVERVAREANRMQIEYSELPNPAGSNGWWVRESPQNAYGSEPAGKAPSNSPRPTA